MKKEKDILIDRYGRHLTYLRVSVTDRCNLRCQYCMPRINFSWLPHDKILTYEEILKVCRAFAAIGITKVRLTGGEPLVRRDLINLAERLTEIDGLEKICITTNGVLLEEYADALFKTGIRHINISLDSMNPERFAYITGFNLFERVWRGIKKALEKGFSPIKINSVIMKGINDHEITALAGLSLKYPIQIRFIEFMPFGHDILWNPARFISCDKIRDQIEQALGKLRPLPTKSKSAGPASIYSLDKGPGSVGFIGALSHRFCKNCNRLRLTAEGRLRLCLFSDEEVDVKKALRRGQNEEDLGLFFHRAILKKPKELKFSNKENLPCTRSMSSIGG